MADAIQQGGASNQRHPDQQKPDQSTKFWAALLSWATTKASTTDFSCNVKGTTWTQWWLAVIHRPVLKRFSFTQKSPGKPTKKGWFGVHFRKSYCNHKDPKGIFTCTITMFKQLGPSPSTRPGQRWPHPGGMLCSQNMWSFCIKFSWV